MGFAAISHEVPARWCDVVGEGCKAAPDVAETRAECFACGNPVCTSPGCSKVRRFFFNGRRRICENCAEMHELV